MLSNKIAGKVHQLRVVGKRYVRKESFLDELHRELRSLRQDLPGLPELTHRPKLVFSHETGLVHDVKFQRSGRKVIISLDWEYARIIQPALWEQLIAHYYWYARCGSDVGPVTINISDGDTASTATLAQCSFRDDVTLLPDMHFFRNRGYLTAGKVFREADNVWADRSDDIIWRGSAFGCGYTCFETNVATHPTVLQRIRLAHLAKDSDVDFRFTEHLLTRQSHHVMYAGGFMAGRVPEYSWVNRKYAIDIDGYTNAWSNFYIRLKLGCCVLKVGSDFGFRQWYYHKLQPYVHYVPIKADLSDFFSQIDWVKTHQKEAAEIATAGRQLADSMDFDSETAEAVRLITQHSRKN
ncbi:MAG: hypothetical protein JKY31_02300 [Rhodobacteraceae bacterium]|nr:hypothetical protein [Paracoccaceae bacterium]